MVTSICFVFTTSSNTFKICRKGTHLDSWIPWSQVYSVTVCTCNGAGSDVIGQHEVSRQISLKSRSKEITRGGGSSFWGGGQSTSRTLSKILILENKGRGEPIGKNASNSPTDNFSRIIQQFGGATGGGKINTQKNNNSLVNLTPTKRRLVQNQNTKILIDSFENSPVESNQVMIIRESPAKRRRYTSASGGGGRYLLGIRV